jgi:hypothetical protein
MPAGGFMELDWVSVYQAALIELEQAKISGRITEGQTAIIGRVESLSNVPASDQKRKRRLKMGCVRCEL